MDGIIPSLQRYLRRIVRTVAVTPVFALAFYAALWLRFEGVIEVSWLNYWLAMLPVFLIVKVAIFSAFRMESFWQGYATFHDLLTLSKAATCSSLGVVVTSYLLLAERGVPRSVLILDCFLTILIVGGIQAVIRLFRDGSLASFFTQNRTSVLIVGTNDSGEALLREIRRNQQLAYQVVGFISDRGTSVGSFISGVPVLGTLDDTYRIAERHNVSEILITAGELSGRDVRCLLDNARSNDIEVKVLPSYEQMLRGHVKLQPRTVSIEDLLGREPVELNMRELHRWIEGQVLMVTGSAGSIGSEICRQLLQFRPKKLVVIDRSECGQFFLERELQQLKRESEITVCLADINDYQRMNHLFKRHQPDIVFHAAAYKHVPLLEDNAGEAVKNISLATKLLADLANQQNVKAFVMVSTDKAVRPTSIMGACKRAAELYVQSMAARSKCRFVTVRFGNVLDSAGSVVPIFRQQISEGGPVTVTDAEMTRYFMTIPEASQLVIQAGAMGNGGEIFVLDMGNPVKIVDLAADMIRLSGLKVNEDIDIKIVGMRPGEKLFEELRGEAEKQIKTSHTKINIAESEIWNFDEVATLLSQLQLHADGSRDQILDVLAPYVSFYRGERAESALTAKAA